MNSYGVIRLALTDQDFCLSAKQNDILVTGSRSTQRILVGTSSNVVSPLQISGSNVTISSLILSNDFVPKTDMGASLGASNKRFKDLYLSGNSIYLGSNMITSDPQTLAVTFKTPTTPAAAVVASYLQLGVGSNAITIVPNTDGSVNFQALDPTNSNIDSGKLALTSKSGTVVLQASSNSNLNILNNLTTQTATVSNVLFLNTITTVNGKIGVGVTSPDDRLQVNGTIRATKIVASDGGSSTAPSFSWFLNPSTGMYLPDFNKLGLVTSGSNRVWIDSAGFVGINTITPSNTLDVAGTTCTSNLTVTANASIKTLSSSNAYITSLNANNFSVSNILASSTLYGSNSSFSNAFIANLQTTTLSTSNITTPLIIATSNTSSNLIVPYLATITSLVSSNNTFSNLTVNNTGFVSTLTSSNVSISNLTVLTTTSASNIITNNLVVQSASASIIPVLTSLTITTSNLSASNVVLSNLTVPRINLTNGNNIAIGISTDSTTGIQMGISGSDRQIKFYTWSNPILSCINRAQNTSGFVGINNSNPLTNLDVTGTVNVSGVLTVPYIQSTAGNINNPSYAFNGNTAGMFSPGSNQLALATQGAYAVFVDSNGYVGIGTTTTTNFTYRLNVNGGIFAEDNVYLASDQRKKSNLVRIDNALAKLQNITGYTYTLHSNCDRQAGLIAQEVETVLPEVVSTDKDGYKAIAYGNTAALLVNALKELADEVKTLKADIIHIKSSMASSF
jgi:hypothetical protein